MMVTKLGQQYNVGEKKPTVILDTYIVVTSGYVILVAYSFLNVCMYGQHFQQSMIWIDRVSFQGHHLNGKKTHTHLKK